MYLIVNRNITLYKSFLQVIADYESIDVQVLSQNVTVRSLLAMKYMYSSSYHTVLCYKVVLCFMVIGLEFL